MEEMNVCDVNKIIFVEHKPNADLDIYNAINVADSSRCIDDV